MRLLAILAVVSIALSGCINEQPRDNNPNSRPQEEDSGYDDNDREDDHDDRPEEDDDREDSPSCAPAPSGAGSWEKEGPDGLYCNYEWSGAWAYSLNSNESACVEASWAPYQPYGGYMKIWYSDDGNKGCDLFIERP